MPVTVYRTYFSPQGLVTVCLVFIGNYALIIKRNWGFLAISPSFLSLAALSIDL